MHTIQRVRRRHHSRCGRRARPRSRTVHVIRRCEDGAVHLRGTPGGMTKHTCHYGRHLRSDRRTLHPGGQRLAPR
jgi:hypothetical protein